MLCTLYWLSGQLSQTKFQPDTRQRWMCLPHNNGQQDRGHLWSNHPKHPNLKVYLCQNLQHKRNLQHNRQFLNPSLPNCNIYLQCTECIDLLQLSLQQS